MGSRLRDTVRYLFEFFCEVSPGDHMSEPFIVRKYPESYKGEEELKNVPKFTFPCQLDNTFVQHYSFVLTSDDSKYTFCFCRYDPRSNTALVLLSHLPWHDVFYKLLNSISNLINSPEKAELTSFLEACRIRPPLPGHTLKVTYNAGHSVFSCQSPDTRLPCIPDNCNLTEYFSAVDTKCMAGLWAALLHERRVAIVASKPSRLSACVQAANATLFPMSWQHIFIPILPKHLVDYLLAPMPFLIGVPASVMETVRMSEIGDVVILDVDANELRSPFQDLESLPSDLVSSLKKALSDKNALGDAVSRSFLRALVCLIGGYRDAIRIEKGQLITFNPEAFVRTRKNMQPFLRKILQSQIFQQFIDERLDLLNSGRGFNDEFEVECNHYAEKLGTGSGQRLKQQYRDWAKTVKKEGGAFFKNFKDKANPAVQSAVKTNTENLDVHVDKSVLENVKQLKEVEETELACQTQTKYLEEVSSMTDISVSSLKRISNEGKLNNGVFSTPGKKRPHKATVRQGGKNMKSAVKGLKNKIPKTGSRPSSINTTDDSRFSCGSATPVSSDSSDSSPSRDGPRDVPAELRLDLLTEMESLFKNRSRRDSLPNSSLNSEMSLLDKAKTLAPSLPPRLPDRPKTPLRYPIIFTKKLVDLSDAPAPPPRAQPALNHSHFVTNITKTSHASDFLSSTIRFTEGKDTGKLKLITSPSRRPGDAPAPAPNGALRPVPPRPQDPAPRKPPTTVPRFDQARTPTLPNRGKLQESCGSTDLIKLDDSPTNLEDFDPLKCRDKNEKVETNKATDSALLHEYGLDFSQFGLGLADYCAGTSARADPPLAPSPAPAPATASSVPRGWTTFN